MASTNFTNSVTLTDASWFDDVDTAVYNWLTVAGTDTITATGPVSMSAYSAGQRFRFVSAGANTGAVTLNISSLGAKSVTKNGTTALASGDIPSGAVVEVTYDGTRFQITKIKQGTASTFDVGTAAGNIVQLDGSAKLPAVDGSQITNTSGPAFSAYLNSAQSINSGTFTKVALDAEDFDTNNCFDTTNNRFTPTKAGYYQINGAAAIAGATTGIAAASIYKNGVEWKRGLQADNYHGEYQRPAFSTLVYLNGTTDYVELYAYQTSGAAKAIDFSSIQTWFNGVWIRS